MLPTEHQEIMVLARQAAPEAGRQALSPALFRALGEQFGGRWPQEGRPGIRIFFPGLGPALSFARTLGLTARQSGVERMCLFMLPHAGKSGDEQEEIPLPAGIPPELERPGAIIAAATLRPALEAAGAAFALAELKAEEGAAWLAIPAEGSLADKGPDGLQDANFFLSLWRKGVPQLLAGYLVAAWSFLQFAEWILQRYQLSPHWVDVLLGFFAAMIPSVALFSLYREKLQSGKAPWLPRLALPVNLAVAGLALALIFRGTDLGAVTQTLTLTNEYGQSLERTVIKEDFRKRAAVFHFAPEQDGDTTGLWQSVGIPLALYLDLTQNEYLYIDQFYGLSPAEKVLSGMLRYAEQMNFTYLLTGSFRQKNGQFAITSRIYNTRRGSLAREISLEGPDFFQLLDSASLMIRRGLGLSEQQIRAYQDLSLQDMITHRLECYRRAAMGVLDYENELPWLESAIAEDSTSVLPYYFKATSLFEQQKGLSQAREAIAAARRHSARLPAIFELIVRYEYYNIRQEPEKALPLLEIQAELQPNNLVLLEQLAFSYLKYNRHDKALATFQQLSRLSPGNLSLRSYAGSMFLNQGQYDEGIDWIRRAIADAPGFWRHYAVLGELNLFKKDYEKAREAFQKAIALNSSKDQPMSRILESIDYLEQHPLPLPDVAGYIGQYRDNASEARAWASELNGALFIKNAYSGGLLTYPLGESHFISFDGEIDNRFYRDENGRVYLYVNRFANREEEYYWKQDGLIRNMEEAIRNRRYENAADLCRRARAAHPKHFYLELYARFLDYQLQQKEKAPQTLAGSYGPHQVLFDGQEWSYQRHGEPQLQMLPLSSSRFMFPAQYERMLEVGWQGEKVAALRLMKYDVPSGEWKVVEEWRR